jgi:hypothetical protein
VASQSVNGGSLAAGHCSYVNHAEEMEQTRSACLRYLTEKEEIRNLPRVGGEKAGVFFWLDAGTSKNEFADRKGKFHERVRFFEDQPGV